MFFSGLSAFLQFFLDAIASSINLLFSLFPPSPFTLFTVDTEITQVLATVNTFIPIAEFVTITEAWLVGVAAYYLYSIWARWIKAID